MWSKLYVLDSCIPIIMGIHYTPRQKKKKNSNNNLISMVPYKFQSNSSSNKQPELSFAKSLLFSKRVFLCQQSEDLCMSSST